METTAPSLHRTRGPPPPEREQPHPDRAHPGAIQETTNFRRLSPRHLGLSGSRPSAPATAVNRPIWQPPCGRSPESRRQDNENDSEAFAPLVVRPAAGRIGSTQLAAPWRGWFSRSRSFPEAEYRNAERHDLNNGQDRHCRVN